MKSGVVMGGDRVGKALKFSRNEEKMIHESHKQTLDLCKALEGFFCISPQIYL